MAYNNELDIEGRVTSRGVDMNYTASGKALAKWGLMCGASHKKENGEYDVFFINCVAWEELAETIYGINEDGESNGQAFDTGDIVRVQGRLNIRKYVRSDGNDGIDVSCTVKEFFVVPMKKRVEQEEEEEEEEDASPRRGVNSSRHTSNTGSNRTATRNSSVASPKTNPKTSATINRSAGSSSKPKTNRSSGNEGGRTAPGRSQRSTGKTVAEEFDPLEDLENSPF